jgi:hypothetical protein
VRIVSDQSEDDIRRRDTRRGLVWPLRELAANILRIVNGAGKPWELSDQFRACHDAIREYVEAHDALPPDYEVQEILDCDRAWHRIRPGAEERRAEEPKLEKWQDDSEIEREIALRLIRKGALQMVASRLLQQIPQQGRGEQDLHNGMRMLERANEQRRKSQAKRKTTYEEALAYAQARADKRTRKKKPPGDEEGGPGVL